jgi:hypothetical protein
MIRRDNTFRYLLELTRIIESSCALAVIIHGVIETSMVTVQIRLPVNRHFG